MEDDLYGDLDNVHIEQVKPKSTKTLELERKVNDLQALVDALKEENETLKRNMGTLFRTARSEIQRKDAEIKAITEAIR
jgi:predicted RNase H-like nuclease (RuvC/YqgF family)